MQIKHSDCPISPKNEGVEVRHKLDLSATLRRMPEFQDDIGAENKLFSLNDPDVG